jgi:hypothetical protein
VEIIFNHAYQLFFSPQSRLKFFAWKTGISPARKSGIKPAARGSFAGMKKEVPILVRSAPFHRCAVVGTCLGAKISAQAAEWEDLGFITFFAGGTLGLVLLVATTLIILNRLAKQPRSTQHHHHRRRRRSRD